MAKTTITQITDDIDGSSDATEVTFSYDGTDYTIDLAKKNRAALDKALKPYLEAATKVSKRSSQTTQRRTAKASGRGRDLAAIRAWAAENNLQVSERGRIPKSVLEQYDAAHA